MTEPDRYDAAIAATQRLEESVRGLKDEVVALRTYGRRNRHYIAAIAVSLVFDVALSIVVFVVAVQLVKTNDLATANLQTQIATCESSNESRQVSTNLWNYVLDTAGRNPDNQVGERKQQIEDFRAYMQRAYAPRDCSLIGK